MFSKKTSRRSRDNIQIDFCSHLTFAPIGVEKHPEYPFKISHNTILIYLCQIYFYYVYKRKFSLRWACNIARIDEGGSVFKILTG